MKSIFLILVAIATIDCPWISVAFGQDLDDLVGEYRREPVENDWHVGEIQIVIDTGKLRWINKAGKSWGLTPTLSEGTLETDANNPYRERGAKKFKLDIRNGKLVGFWFQNSLYLKDGATVLPQLSRGFHGYISMRTQAPPEGYGYGASFYVSVWPLTEESLAGFQIGLPSTWIIPDNRNFDKPLCPPGTYARDNFHERGPFYRDVFQTIEGGLGYWVSTQFPSTTPKYRINGTPNGYTHEISSPGWGFGKPISLAPEKMGIAQLSNRLVIPPDGLTFAKGQTGKVLGNAWMVLPLASAKKGKVVTTGDNNWTLFLNAENFKGPVAFWIPDTWSRLSKSYPVIDQRGLDSRPGLMGSGAMEVNTVPCFEVVTNNGVTYSKIPKIQFPVNKQGETFLMQDVTFYAKNSVNARGRFAEQKAWKPDMSANPVRFSQGAKKTNLAGIEKVVQTQIFGKAGQQVFGLQWSNANDTGVLPQYFKQIGDQRIAIDEQDVPESTRLVEQEFRRKGTQRDYESPQTGPWTNPGPKTATSTVNLSDGSQVTSAWYRFVDQPSMAALNWSDREKNRIQNVVEKIHRTWTIDKKYMPAPSRGTLAQLDHALLVTPPKGFEIGFVPIAVSQRLQEKK